MLQYDSPRLVPRYSFVVEIEVTDLQSGSQNSERTKDLSLFGCGLNTLRSFPKGTRVRIKLPHERADVAALARGVYGRTELGMGVVLTSVEPEEEWILEGWIAELMSIPIAHA